MCYCASLFGRNSYSPGTAKNDRSTKWTKIPYLTPSPSSTVFLEFASQLCGPIVPWDPRKSKHRRSRRGRKSQENGNRHFCQDLMIFFETLFTDLLCKIAILLVQRKFTCHGNLIGKSRITCLYNSKSLITLWCPVPPHAANLVSITHHAVNFGTITRHAKTLCRPLSIKRFREFARTELSIWHFVRVITLSSFFKKISSFFNSRNCKLHRLLRNLNVHLLINVLWKLRRNEETLQFCRT